MHVVTRISPLALLLFPFFAFAQAAPEEQRAAGCRAAVIRYMNALDSADGDTLRDSIYRDPNIVAQREGVNAVVDCVIFQRALEGMVAQRWGEEAVRPISSRTTFTPAD